MHCSPNERPRVNVNLSNLSKCVYASRLTDSAVAHETPCCCVQSDNQAEYNVYSIITCKVRIISNFMSPAFNIIL